MATAEFQPLHHICCGWSICVTARQRSPWVATPSACSARLNIRRSQRPSRRCPTRQSCFQPESRRHWHGLDVEASVRATVPGPCLYGIPISLRLPPSRKHMRPVTGNGAGTSNINLARVWVDQGRAVPRPVQIEFSSLGASPCWTSSCSPARSASSHCRSVTPSLAIVCNP
jgi:hypothetical protein